MKNKIEDLRDHMFEALEGLKDGTISHETATSMCKVSGQIIESAKVEVDYIRAVGEATALTKGSGFIPSDPRRPGLIDDRDKQALADNRYKR